MPNILNPKRCWKNLKKSDLGNLETKGATLGTVVDALRGKPGEIRVLGI